MLPATSLSYCLLVRCLGAYTAVIAIEVHLFPTRDVVHSDNPVPAVDTLHL